MSGHVGLYHNFDPSKIKFFALDHVPAHEHGGNIDKILLHVKQKGYVLFRPSNILA